MSQLVSPSLCAGLSIHGGYDFALSQCSSQRVLVCSLAYLFPILIGQSKSRWHALVSLVHSFAFVMFFLQGSMDAKATTEYTDRAAAELRDGASEAKPFWIV
ncbi:MAG: hypothetical protein ACLVEJ_01785 [Parabacteroides sp.]